MSAIAGLILCISINVGLYVRKHVEPYEKIIFWFNYKKEEKLRWDEYELKIMEIRAESLAIRFSYVDPVHVFDPVSPERLRRQRWEAAKLRMLHRWTESKLLEQSTYFEGLVQELKWQIPYQWKYRPLS